MKDVQIDANFHNTVLAIDPGTEKCGVALVRRVSDEKVEVLWRSIVKVGGLAEAVKHALGLSPIKMVIVGNGTKSKDTVHMLRAAHPSLGILVIDERDTSLQARERYWEHHKRRGWRRILPSTLQVPPEPVDDFVALILAERVLLPGS